MITRVEKFVSSLNAAVELLRAGELVAFPTETVYGLGADARRADAVAKIYQAKGRPPGNPLIVHIADGKTARECVTNWPTIAEKLADQFWPGPLTLILPRSNAITPLVSAGRSTVAIRCPNHPAAQALLKAFNGPIAAPSANRSGFISPTTAAHVLAELNGRIPLILDAGPSNIGLESTVIDLSTDPPTLLRPGSITAEMLRPTIPNLRIANLEVRESDSAPSPGLHHRHYAPHTPAYRFSQSEWPEVSTFAQQKKSIALLTWNDQITLSAPAETIRMPADPAAYARTLYAALHDADAKSPQSILILMPPNDTNLWAAVNDRLRRATEPVDLLLGRGAN